MRAGRLKTRRYKVYRPGRKWVWLLLFALLGAGAAYSLNTGKISLPRLPVFPAPTLTPEDAAADARTLILPGKTWYALQLGVFDRESAARELADAYAARGAGGYVWRQNGFRVLAAAYETRSGAQAVQTQLLSLHQVETAVTEIIRPEITLRASGQRAQLTALEDSFAALSKLAEHLSSLSLSLDGGEAAPEDVRAALQSERDTLNLLRERLAALFDGGAPSAVGELSGILNDLVTALDRALAARGNTALGAQVKYCQLLCVCRGADYGASLARQPGVTGRWGAPAGCSWGSAPAP